MSPFLRLRRSPLTFRRTALVVAILGIVLLLSSILALACGSVSIPLRHVTGVLLGDSSTSETERIIILQIRLPRVLMGITVGAGLSVAGLIFQALLRNPLAEPYILGISSGGTLGTVLALSLAGGAGVFVPQLASFAGSATVMVLVYAIASRHGRLDTFTLLLSGVMIGAFFNAGVLVLIAVINRDVRSAFLWLMGNLSNADLSVALVVIPPVIVATGILTAMAKRFNLIATGDESALQLGVNVATLKKISYALASLITGLVVSVSGVVGFVGLIIPHICRLVFGPDHRLILPASFLAGGTFMVLADLLSRTLLSPTEIPVGAVTAAIGAPVFIYLLRKN